MLAETGCTDRQALIRWWQGRSRERPPFLSALGWLGRLAAGAAALSVGLFLLLAGVYGAPRLLNRVELRTHVLRALRPLEPPPVPSPTPRPGVVFPAQFLWAADGGPDPLTRPRVIAADTAGNVYVKDSLNHRVVKFDPDGQVLTRWGSEGSGPGEFLFLKDGGRTGDPGGIAVAPDGTVYVSDYSGRVQHFDPDGRYLGAWGSKGTGPGQLDEPIGMAFDAQGRLYITDAELDRVQVFDQGGKLLAAWGQRGKGPGEFDSPASIAVALDGSVYVGDVGNHRVQRFDADGRFLGEFGGEGFGPGLFVQTAGVAVDATGRVYVGEHGRNMIQVFDPSGRYLGEWGDNGSIANRQFNLVAQIALDGQGNIYVCDFGGRRVQKFRLP